jgi:hypothetical protein
LRFPHAKAQTVRVLLADLVRKPGHDEVTADIRELLLTRSQLFLVYRREIRNSVFDTPRVRSKPPHEKQYDQDDQDDADHTYAAVTEAVAVAAEAATETTKQEDDEDDDKYESDRHDLSPVAAPNRTSLRTPTEKLLIGIFPLLLLEPPLPTSISIPVRHLGQREARQSLAP